MSLKATQYLLVLSATLFALLPIWGGMAFAAAWVLLGVGTWSRTRRARRILESNFDRLGPLPAGAETWARRYALAYLWPDAATEWGTTWQTSGLLALLVAPCVGAHALFTQRWGLLGLLVPLGVVFFVGGWMSTRIKVDERVSDGVAPGDKALHEALRTKAALKTAVGRWPPEPPPDRPS